jgi:hypothetical protein
MNTITKDVSLNYAFPFSNQINTLVNEVIRFGTESAPTNKPSSYVNSGSLFQDVADEFIKAEERILDGQFHTFDELFN